ncbi:MAG: cell division protein FtsZ [Bacteroidetes bacterium]|nr:cell division protein FtsZ [Bacteroidota bacterium]
MQFDLPKELSSIIKVIGVGGGGSNAVNHMFKQGIKGVDFIVCNTDQQALDMSPVPTKIALGASLTEGRGAGSLPEVGKNSAIENIEELKEILAKNTKMVFITAGMGGGTGTGAAPVIAKVAKELGILTVGIVTVPFAFEGKKRKSQAEQGIEELKQCVDTLLIISNDKLREIYGNLKIIEAFGKADDVLTTAAKSIAEIITVTLHVNVDFADIVTVMKDSGVAIMGSATASGENRAIRAVENALASPLLNDNDIRGARYILLNITCGSEEITMDELGDITDFIQESAGQTAEIIKGYGVDPELGDSVNITIIATGFNTKGFKTPGIDTVAKKQEKVVLNLEETPVVNVAPVVTSTTTTTITESFVSDTTSTVNAEIENTTSSLEPFLLSTNEETIIENIVEETPVNSFVNQTTDLSNVDEWSGAPIANKNEHPELEFTVRTVEASERVENIEKKEEPVQDVEQMRKAQERINKLKELSFKLKTPNGLNELENEPAYKRRNVQLDQVSHSSESQVSRYTLTPEEGDDKKVNIRPNNSFLHDNVD